MTDICLLGANMLRFTFSRHLPCIGLHSFFVKRRSFLCLCLTILQFHVTWNWRPALLSTALLSTVYRWTDCADQGVEWVVNSKLKYSNLHALGNLCLLMTSFVKRRGFLYNCSNAIWLCIKAGENNCHIVSYMYLSTYYAKLAILGWIRIAKLRIALPADPNVMEFMEYCKLSKPSILTSDVLQPLIF